MFYVINYFKKLALKRILEEKVVFVASDDPNAINELRIKYSDFKFIDKKYYFNEVDINDSKYTPTNLLHTMFDIQFLARSEFLICTMSSSVRNTYKNIFL
jgi:hypothetical protein